MTSANPQGNHSVTHTRPSSLVGGHSNVAEYTESNLQDCTFCRQFGTTILTAQCHNPEEQYITVKTSYLILTMTNHHNLRWKQRTAMYCILCSDTGALFYLTTHLTTSLLHMMAGSAVIAATPPCPEPGSMHSVQHTAVNRFSFSIFKESAGNVFLWLTDSHHN
jgi:hypothetical protein